MYRNDTIFPIHSHIPLFFFHIYSIYFFSSYKCTFHAIQTGDYSCLNKSYFYYSLCHTYSPKLCISSCWLLHFIDNLFSSRYRCYHSGIWLFSGSRIRRCWICLLWRICTWICCRRKSYCRKLCCLTNRIANCCICNYLRCFCCFTLESGTINFL